MKKALILQVETEEGIELHELNRQVIEALLPTDLEHFVNRPMTLLELPMTEVSKANVIGNIQFNGLSIKEAKQEEVSDLKKEIADLEEQIKAVEAMPEDEEE